MEPCSSRSLAGQLESSWDLDYSSLFRPYHGLLACVSYWTGQSLALFELLFSNYPVVLSCEYLLAFLGSAVLRCVRGPSVSLYSLPHKCWHHAGLLTVGGLSPLTCFWIHGDTLSCHFVIVGNAVDGILALLSSCSVFMRQLGEIQKLCNHRCSRILYFVFMMYKYRKVYSRKQTHPLVNFRVCKLYINKVDFRC